jgi:D-lactate dehydrogenase
VRGVEFARAELLPRLCVARRARSVAVHPTCSLVQLSADDDLLTVAAACAEEVVIPKDAGCCGFTGDRGFMFSALTAAATLLGANNLLDVARDDYLSSNRMCEVPMTRAAGRNYRPFIHLLDETTRARYQQ